MPQVMNCATTVPGLVTKNWLTSTQISRCEESGHYITSIAQDKMWNLKKYSCKKDFPSHATLTPGLYLMSHKLWVISYDMRVQLQIHLWIFTHAFWRKPKEAFWCHHDKIWGTFQSKSSMMQAARSKKCSRNIFYDFVRFYRLINTATIGSWRCSCLNLHYFCGMILGDATIRQLFQVWFCNRYRLSAFLKEIKTYRITQEP